MNRADYFVLSLELLEHVIIAFLPFVRNVQSNPSWTLPTDTAVWQLRKQGLKEIWFFKKDI